jgi:type I restriction enzyme S subunit
MQPVDIRPDHLRLVLDILRQHVPMAEVLVFGSRAKWLARDTSDLDLCIRDAAPLSFEQMGLLREAFEESNLPYKVDVVDWATISSSFRKVVERHKVVVQEAKRSGGRADDGTVQLGNVCSKIGSGATPRGGKEAYKGGATALIRSQNIYNDGFHRNGLVYIDDNQSLELRNVEVQPNDVLLNITGDSVARCCQVAADVLPARVNQHVAIIRPKPSVLDTRFLRYVLISHDYQSRLLALASAAATRPALTMAMIEGLDIQAPPLSEQRAIAHILGALDDKIELNRRMNETLEAMARALFQSWFVDFDPVRAKLEARWQSGDSLPGLSANLCELFPSRLVNSELGEIPEEWEVKPLDEIAAFLNGLALQKFPATDPTDSLPVIKIAELRNGVSHKSDRASRDVPEKYIIKDGDFLFSWSGSLLAKFWTEGEGALNQHLFKVTSERYPMWFVSYWVHYHLEEFQSIAASKATTMGHIQRGHLKSAMTICPADDALKKFDVVMAPLIDEAIQNELESRTLATLRDTLLPKLLSGEISVASFSSTNNHGEY